MKDVTAAIIVQDGLILIARGGKGKILPANNNY